MAKRKQQNLEIERQVKKRKLLFRTVSAIVAAVIVVAVAVGIWTVQDSRWLMRYDGGRVAVRDYRALMDFWFENNPMWHDMAINTAQAITVVRDRATMHNVDFTPEERTAAEQEMREIRESMRAEFGWDVFHYITDARMAELFETDPLVERLMNIYVPVYNVDEAEFAEALEEHLGDAIYEHMNMQVLMVLTETREEIEEAYELIGTMDFEDIVRQFTEGLGEDDEIEPVSALVFADWFEFEPEDRENLFGLAVGEYSRIIEWIEEEDSLYFLFKMVSREEPDVSAITADFREDFIEGRRRGAFDDLVMEWIEAANFTMNRRGLNTLNLNL